jgi:hypothetical protein
MSRTTLFFGVSAALIALSLPVLAQDGTTSIQRTRTLQDGRTISSDRTITRTENGATVTGTATGPNGQTRTFDNTITKTGEGQWQGTRNVTGPNGETRTINTTGQRTDTGVQKTQTWTGQDGTERSRNVEWTRNGDGTATKTITGPNGQTRSKTHSRRRGRGQR